MKTSNLDVVRRGLAVVWDTGGRKFVTFEVEGRGGPDAERWIQYLDGELNVRWPLNEDPATALSSRGVALPAGAFVAWHVAGENAAIALGDADLDDVARLVVALFTRIVAPAAGFALSTRIDDHR